MILIDTSSLIHLLRKKGNPIVKNRVLTLIKNDQAALCPMVIAELWMGASTNADKDDIKGLTSLLHHCEINDHVWKLANRLAHLCRIKGTSIPSSDLIITACAFYHGTEIESVDRHFEILSRYKMLL